MCDANKKKSTFAACLYVKKKNRSGSINVVVIEKSGGRFRDMKTLGISSDKKEVAELYKTGKK